MIKEIIYYISRHLTLLRSLSAQSIGRVIFLISLSVIPMMASFWIVSLIFQSNITIWTIVPVIIGISISRAFYYAKRIHKQEQMAKQTAK